MKNNIISYFFFASVISCHSQQAELPTLHNEVTSVPVPVKKLSATERQKYHDKAEHILERSLLRGSFNGAILLAKNGEIVYEKYVGKKDPRVKSSDSLTAETPFQIASTGKTMTAAAVLKLVEEGRVNLDDELSRLFPGFPYPGVTVKMLLNHRSGLPNYLYYMEKGDWDRKLQATNQDVLNTLIKWQPPRSANPDQRFQYCNTNYVLLALIVEKASGLSFPEYMKTTFFQPLGMNNTFVISPNEQEQHLISYQHNNYVWSLDFSDGPYGDKNIYSTPRDLLKWDRALTDGEVLQEKTLELAYTPYSNEKPGVHNYGLGWRLLLYPANNNKTVIYHNGHWHGFNSAFARLPEENATVIILSNKYNTAVYSVAKKLYDVFGHYGTSPEEGEE